jgi:hypothetical protein
LLGKIVTMQSEEQVLPDCNGKELAMAGVKKWVVTTSGQRPLADVQAELEHSGFAVENSLAEIGILTGSGDEDSIDRLRGIAGIADISPDTPIDIGPPGSSLTW